MCDFKDRESASAKSTISLASVADVYISGLGEKNVVLRFMVSIHLYYYIAFILFIVHVNMESRGVYFLLPRAALLSGKVSLEFTLLHCPVYIQSDHAHWLSSQH